MLASSSGYRTLLDTIAHVRTMAGDASVFEQWYDRRWSEVVGQLRQFVCDPQVGRFVNDYAAPLAESVREFVFAGLVSEATEAAVDFMEELLSQTKAFAASVETVATSGSDPALPGVDDPVDMALAA